MQLSTLFYGFSLLQGAMASPVAELAVEVESRNIEPKGPTLGDIPWPRMPALRRKFCDAFSNVSNLIYA
jgi:hypothetical protein